MRIRKKKKSWQQSSSMAFFAGKTRSILLHMQQKIIKNEYSIEKNYDRCFTFWLYHNSIGETVF